MVTFIHHLSSSPAANKHDDNIQFKWAIFCVQCNGLNWKFFCILLNIPVYKEQFLPVKWN